jgi:acetyl-CoA C-acetyltransferase/acetyl-CoA acyltransferase
MSLQRKIYLAAGFNTVSLGTGRSEFHPKKKRPGIDHYIREAGIGALAQAGGAANIDETVIGNFMASRFNNQAHLSALVPSIDKGLRYKPAVRVEGACASGGLALVTGMKSVLAGTANAVLVVGVEVQNTVKAIYGADYLALAGWFNRRKKGHAYFFPGEFSDRAASYIQKYGEDARKGFARWYANCIENARLCKTAQEHENADPDPFITGLTPYNPSRFVDALNVFDCSKVSDGASAIVVFSEEGLKKAGIARQDAVEISAFAHSEDNLIDEPENLTELTTTKNTVRKVLGDAGIKTEDIATVETHDCFTIAGILAVEAMGYAKEGEGAAFVAAGKTARNGEIPFNTTGGLIGWGHPTGATGVHQAVTIWEQLTNRAGEAQIPISKDRPYALSINMGGNDRTVVSVVYKKTKQ